MNRSFVYLTAALVALGCGALALAAPAVEQAQKQPLNVHAIVMFFVFVMGKPSQHGFAVGLLLLVALGLTIDFYAERRAKQYESALQAVGALPS